MSVVTNNPEYSIVIYARTAGTLAVGSRILEVNNPKNIGWGDYLNDVPEAFFSLYQEDEQVKVLRSILGMAHIRIYRTDPSSGERAIVWAGIFGTETDEREDDVIFYSHGYLAALFWLVSNWEQTWTAANLATIVTDSWVRAKTEYHAAGGSELNFVTTGTIETPVTTSGGATPLILPVYSTFLKPILNILREVSAVGRSDTTNNVVFEITHSETPTFNFWKNKGVNTNVVYNFGGAEVQDYWYQNLTAHRRNQILGVGTSPRDLVLKTDQAATPGLEGRRVTPIYFQWVRDQTELERISKLRLARAKVNHFRVGLLFYPGGAVPPGMSYSPWKLADRVRIRIDRGITTLDEMMIVVGTQVIFKNGVESLTLLVESVTGT